jgi:hypothetical protein
MLCRHCMMTDAVLQAGSTNLITHVPTTPRTPDTINWTRKFIARHCSLQLSGTGLTSIGRCHVNILSFHALASTTAYTAIAILKPVCKHTVHWTAISVARLILFKC